MFYGYFRFSKHWKEKRKMELARRLCEDLGIDWHSKIGEKTPYIEVDKSGVKIRRLTYLSDEEVESLIRKADKIYHEVME